MPLEVWDERDDPYEGAVGHTWAPDRFDIECVEAGDGEDRPCVAVDGELDHFADT